MISSLFNAVYSAVFPPGKLLELPPDIWIGILSYFTAHELAKMLRISSGWRTNVLAPCLWNNIKLEDNPRWHLVALRSFLARAHNTPVAIEIRTDGRNANASYFPWEETGVFELIREHVVHIRVLNLRLCDITPRFRVEVPLENITGPEFSALQSLLETPMPILEKFSIHMRWDVLSQAIPRPFNAEVPSLRTFNLLFQGQISQIPDAGMFPQVRNWHFQRESYPLSWPWDWNAIWSVLSSRGYLSKKEVLFTGRFSSSGERPDMTQHTTFDKWAFRQLELGRDPTWSDTGAVFRLDSGPLPVRAKFEFILVEHSKAVLSNANVWSNIRHLALHDTYEWPFDSDRPGLPPIPPSPMPSLKTLTINCMKPLYQHRNAKHVVKLLQPGKIEAGRRIVAPNLEEVCVKRWAEEAAKTVMIEAAWLVNFLRNHVEISSVRLRRLEVGMKSGLELREGLEESLGAFASLTDVVHIC